MSKPVFISHAAANRELADALVDMLETGIGITDTDVFCSSLEGMGIPSGVNFVDFVRGQISSPRAVVLLLSQDYLASQFCLCELGASWALT
ncbi:MAG: toll/interleukin-1 receptor domain-containing protein, partial [Deltaproteobacteria bacterium]|nr:toll/interleukin-1 receptor domain-containing protein [Deltaproteobacteria bacterium]